MNKQEILKLIAEKIEEHQGPWCMDEYNTGAVEALRDLQTEIVNR
jgi:hypothetical protein